MANKLFDSNTAMMVISGILKDPKILHDQQTYRLTTDDFNEDFYKIIFGSIYNLSMSGVENIDPIDVDIDIAKYPKQYDTYQKNKGLDFLKTLSSKIDRMDTAKFNSYYERLKKFTILRDLNKNGIDTKEFYNHLAPIDKIDKETKKLEDLSVDDIIKGIQQRLNRVEDKYVSRNYITTQEAAKGMRELYFELKHNPEIGLPLEGDILNYVIRGARFGKMYTYSAPTGQGKTRTMVGNACFLSLPRIEPDLKVSVRKNLSKILYVTTEQQADEIQTLILAYVSGVNERKILYGTANHEEEKRILMAIDIIEKYKDNFIIEIIPDPNIALLRAKLVKHILQNDISFIFYDYIFTSPGLIGEFSGARIREDVALMMLANTLKEIAAVYNVFIGSGTQLNDRWEQSIVRNQNHIRGSKAIADKIDVGMIGIKLDSVPEEREIIEAIAQEAKVQVPNVVIDIFKNRRGEYAGVKLFRYFDYGTCRAEDIMLTTSTHEVIKNYEKIEYERSLVDLMDIMTGGEIE